MENLPEKWCIKPPKEHKAEIARLVKSIVDHNLNFDTSSYYYFIDHYGKVGMNYTKPYGFTEINFEQLKVIINAKQKETMATRTLVGYVLKKAYPGSNAVGYKTTNTTTLGGMRLADYPEFWSPVYQQYDNLKVGDYITITVSSKTPNSNSDMAKLNGKTVKITSIETNYGGRTNQVHFDNDGAWCWAQSDDHFRVATAAEIRSVQTKTLPFGPLTFTIEGRVAKCTHGTITKTEVKRVLDWLDTPLSLLGYPLELATSEEPQLKFGCTTGTIAQARAILAAFD